ncbi:MAG: glycosyl hydrolase [Bacteroidetes bacterium OLB9]|nr:MAG: glycosyl hydrolase [Bacteroidetes bacterium OLB9]
MSVRILILNIILIFTLNACKNSQPSSSTETLPPAPTETVIMHEEGGNPELKQIKKRWFIMMHGGDEALWKQSEFQNRLNNYNAWLKVRTTQRGGDEIFANNTIKGKWLERGSSNNAGNVMIADFDPDEEVIYAIGAGGPLFKAELFADEWVMVNDKVQFSTQFLNIIKLDNGTKRLVSAIGGTPYFSDDGGIVWKPSTGVIPPTDGTIHRSKLTKDNHIFILAKKSYWEPYHLYASFDNGETYQSIKTLVSHESGKFDLGYNPHSNTLYLIEKVDDNKANIYSYIPKSKKLEIVQSNSPIAFKNGRANLQAMTVRDSIFFYSYNNDKKFYISKDLGATWKEHAFLPDAPWDMGIYVCPSNPKFMFLGAVDAFRSTNGGTQWSRINHWWQYYGDIYTQLHADMMRIQEFYKSDGTPFILNCNHGGIYYSEDYGATHINIGLRGLNVSQYYDVRTDPHDPYFIYAGSQDQGQQRGGIYGDEISELEQNVSGDYGHIVFTGNGEHLWSVYPGGSIGFYSKPKFEQSPIAGYEIDSKNETVWIPPIIPGPNPSEDVVLAAGGSVNKNSFGSHIIRLQYQGDTIQAEDLPFDFSISGGQISTMAIDRFDSNNGMSLLPMVIFIYLRTEAVSLPGPPPMFQAHIIFTVLAFYHLLLKKNVIYLSGNGYSLSPVYRSDDGGKTFKSISTGMPPTMAFKLAANEDESLIFAATEAGPYVYVKAQKRWYRLTGSNTPDQTYWSVEYVPEIKTARFSTYGRGVWDFVITEVLTSTKEQSMTSTDDIKIAPNPVSHQFKVTGTLIQPNAPYSIINSAGQTLASGRLHRDQPIDVQQLKSGTYFIRIEFKNTQKTLKFVKL